MKGASATSHGIDKTKKGGLRRVAFLVYDFVK